MIDNDLMKRYSFVCSLFVLSILMIRPVLSQENEAAKRDSLSAQKNRSLSVFQVNRLKYAHFIRAKYAFTDSLFRNGLYLSPTLFFSVPMKKNWRKDFNLPIYPELHQPFWQRDFALRAQGGYEQFKFNPAQALAYYKPKEEWEKSKKEFRNKFIPSNLQLSVLNTLWQENSATQLDVYAGIDPEIPITAEKLNVQLDRMVNLGLVERKLISPQHLFMILSPLKAFQVEMSSRNRKNRVYLYRPRVKRREIFQLILARYYRVKNEGVGRPAEIDRLNKKINILLGNKKG